VCYVTIKDEHLEKRFGSIGRLAKGLVGMIDEHDGTVLDFTLKSPNYDIEAGPYECKSPPPVLLSEDLSEEDRARLKTEMTKVFFERNDGQKRKKKR
jgi:hypothetical protein